jgi:hypothetical protein
MRNRWDTIFGEKASIGYAHSEIIMGLRIGQNVEAPFITRASPRVQTSLARSAPAAERRTAAATFFPQVEPEPLRAGFGDGTVSIPGLTVRAIDTNLAGARRIVPTLEESREELRGRLAEQRALLEREPREPAEVRPTPPEPERLDIRREQALAVARTRQFLNSLNEAAAAAAERTGTAAPEPTPTGPTVRIGEENFDLQRVPGEPRLDVLI